MLEENHDLMHPDFGDYLSRTKVDIGENRKKLYTVML
jgi:hypothetical protein